MENPGVNAGPLTALVLGGARSGKSRIAEDMVLAAAGPSGSAVYIATASAAESESDAEMQTRIAAHRARRDALGGSAWQTVEAPLALAAAVAEHTGQGRAVLVDCLTLWLSNLMHADMDIDAETDALCAALAGAAAPAVLVSNEAGQGVVPDNALARRFRDLAGLLNQRCAAQCGRVVLVTAGLAQTLKG